MGILTLIKLYGQFKDVRSIYEDSTGSKASVLMSRKFIGAVLALGAGALLYSSGVQISTDSLNQLTTNVTNLISAIVGIYGFVMFLVSTFKNLKKVAQGE